MSGTSVLRVCSEGLSCEAPETGAGPCGWRGGSFYHFLQHLPLWVGLNATHFVSPWVWAIAIKKYIKDVDNLWTYDLRSNLVWNVLVMSANTQDQHGLSSPIKMAWHRYLGYPWLSPIHSMDLGAYSVICRHGLCQVDGGKDMPLAQRWCWLVLDVLRVSLAG